MEATVVRYCPNCGAQVKAPESVFASPCACPSCKERSQFYDYPNEPTATPVKTSKRNQPGWIDWALWTILAVAILSCLVTLWAFFNDLATITLVGGVVCLLAGLACTGFVALLKRNLARAELDKKKAERALLVSNSKIKAAGEINQGFKKNFDALVAEEKRRIQQSLSTHVEQAKELHQKVEKRVEETEKTLPTIDAVGNRLLDEALFRISKDLTTSNLPDSRRQLKQVIEFCRQSGCTIKNHRENELLHQLEMDHQAFMMEAKYKNERLQVEAKMREEQRVIERIEQEMRQAESERSSIASSLSAILKDSENTSESKIVEMREKLRIAEQKMSEASAPMHQPTAGYFYVLSNIGSFGEGVFLIGSTRLGDPREHIEELSGICVPFPYDIHMIVPSANAEELATKIREQLHESRLNRFNHGKSFFKTTIKTIWQLVVAHHGTVDFVEEPAAKEFRESNEMSAEAFDRMTEMHRTPEKYRDPFDARR